jgi:hypothetical protein
MKHIEGAEVWLHSFLSSVQDGGERSASSPLPLYPRERTPVIIEWEAGWAPEPDWLVLESIKYSALGKSLGT